MTLAHGKRGGHSLVSRSQVKGSSYYWRHAADINFGPTLDVVEMSREDIDEDVERISGDRPFDEYVLRDHCKQIEDDT